MGRFFSLLFSCRHYIPLAFVFEEDLIGPMKMGSTTIIVEPTAFEDA
jgi:hypothetical protein